MTSSIGRQPPMRLLKVHEVATALNLSVKTIRRMIERGELHVHRLNRAIRVPEEEIKRLLVRTRE